MSLLLWYCGLWSANRRLTAWFAACTMFLDLSIDQLAWHHRDITNGIVSPPTRGIMAHPHSPHGGQVVSISGEAAPDRHFGHHLMLSTLPRFTSAQCVARPNVRYWLDLDICTLSMPALRPEMTGPSLFIAASLSTSRELG